MLIAPRNGNCLGLVEGTKGGWCEGEEESRVQQRNIS